MVYFKQIKYFLIYVFIFLFLSKHFDNQSLLSIFYQIDITASLFLLFILIRCFFGYYLFTWLNHYQCLYQFIHFRVSLKQYARYCIPYLFSYSILFILSNTVLCLIFIKQIPIFLILKCTFIDMISFYICLFFIKNKHYMYITFISLILILHVFI